MLCDQASDTINSESLPTAVHPSLATRILPHYIKGFVNAQGGDQPRPLLLIALGCATLPSRASLCIDV
jgi:hypothetical protein